MNCLEVKFSQRYSKEGTSLSEKERELFMRIKDGDGGSKEIIVKSMQGIIYKTAKKYNHVLIDHFDDLVQEGNLGLLKAIGNYDVGRETKFSVYAHHRIRGSIIDYIRLEMKKGFVNLKRATRPNLAYLVDCNKLERGKVSLSEIIPDKEENSLELLLKKELRNTVRKNIRDERDGKIIELILEGDLSIKTISERFGIGESGVSQIKRSFMDKLKNDSALIRYLNKPILQREQI